MNSLLSLRRWGQLILQTRPGQCRRSQVRGWQVERLETRRYLSTANGANWETFIENGSPSNRVDIVFLGDGYTQSEIDTVYSANIDAMLQHMFFENEEPFTRYQNYFNVSRIDVVSAESGVDDPEAGIKRNTALNATYLFDGRTDRLASITDKLGDAFVNKLPFKADMKFVALNSSKYGGAGGPYSVFAGNDPSSTEIALHELGHSFAKLADEYFDPGKFSGSEPKFANVTTSSTGNKWSAWLGYDQPGIGLIGAYEGALYVSNGIYRPSLDSKMRSLGQPFDAIAREAFIQRIYEFVDPIDAALSAGKSIASSATLWVDVVDPLVIQTQWFVDGQLVPGATGPYFVPAEHGFATGTHQVTVEAVDNTDWVRRGTDALHDQRQWTVGANTSTPGLVFSDSAQHLDLTEGGSSVQFDLRLSAPPTQPVQISIPGGRELQVSPDFVEFTPDNWNVPFTLTVSALADNVIDGNDVGDIVYQLSTQDAAYAALTLPRTRAVVRDTTTSQSVQQAPVIGSPRNFFISPDAPDGSLVGSLVVRPGGAGQTLVYEITGGNESGAFVIDSSTGQINVLDSSVLDIQTQPTYNLAVLVTANGDPVLSAAAAIIINLVGAPSISVSSQPLVAQRGKTVAIDKTATLSAQGIASWNGAVLQCLTQANGDTTATLKDTLSVSKELGLRVSGTKLLAGKIQIGTIKGGKKSVPLSVTFNGSAPKEAVQAVMQSISFKTTDSKVAARDVQFQITNIGGQSSNIAHRPIQIVK